MEISFFLQTILLSLFPILIIVIYIHSKWISFHSNAKKNLPPSPKRLPIIGNLHQLGSKPNESFHVLSQKHGPIMLLHLGSVPTIVASSSEAAKEIMKTHDLSFCDRPKVGMSDILMYGSNDVVFGSYGEYWRQLKSILVLHLLSNTRVKSYQKVRENEVSLFISKLVESCGTTVDMGAMFASFIFNINCKVVLGRTLDGSKQADIIKRFMDTLSAFSLEDYIPWLTWVYQARGLTGKAKTLAKELDEFLESVIEEHVIKRKGNDIKNDEEQDFVDILLDIQKDNTKDFILHRENLKVIILDAFLGGTDSGYLTLVWTMSEVIRNPTVMRNLQQELTGVAQGKSMVAEEDLHNMKYLKAVVKESLRLHPPAPFLVPRKAAQDVKLMGYDIPIGTEVIINAWAIARDPALWEEPTKFMPERFLDNAINYQGSHFEWIPFGAGRRKCPGALFSVSVIELVLANILYKFDITLPNGLKNEDLDMNEAFGITVHRKSPLLVTISPRF